MEIIKLENGTLITKDFLRGTKTVICANTEEKAEKLLQILHEWGFKWRTGESLLQRTHFHVYGESTVYIIDDMHYRKSVAYGNVDRYVRDIHYKGTIKGFDLMTNLQQVDSALAVTGYNNLKTDTLHISDLKPGEIFMFVNNENDVYIICCTMDSSDIAYMNMCNGILFTENNETPIRRIACELNIKGFAK